MKKIMVFLSGFFCCLVLVGLIGGGSNKINAQNQTYSFVKAQYPIYVNGTKKNVDAYNFNGNTFLKISDLKSQLKNLSITWDNSDRSVYIAERTGLGFLEYDSKTYVDLSRIAFRYQNGGLPYSYDTKLDCISKTMEQSLDGMVYSSDDDVENEAVYIELLSKKDEVSTHYPNSAYFEYDLVKENLVQLLKMTYENEKYIKETPYTVDPVN